MASKKRRLVTAREPNGRIQREGRDLAPMEVRRLRDAAVRGLRDPEWGTELGRLYLEGNLTGAMYAAGKRWREQATEYRRAIGVFPIRSASLERGSHSHEADPDSEEGQKQAQREANGAERFFAAHAALTSAGVLAESVVSRICEEDGMLCGWVDHQSLRKGLSALVDHYNMLTADQKLGNVRSVSR